MRRKKRSSWASGSGNVPSCSIGFSVASRKNGVGSASGRAVDRDLVLGHRLEQRRLGLRHRAVDLVDEQHVREHRAGPEVELPLAWIPDRQAGHVGRLDVRRALDAVRLRALDRAGERARQHGLGGARHVLEQHVPAARERGEHDADLLPLADHHRLGVVEQLPDDLDRPPDARLRAVRAHAGARRWSLG